MAARITGNIRNRKAAKPAARKAAERLSVAASPEATEKENAAPAAPPALGPAAIAAPLCVDAYPFSASSTAATPALSSLGVPPPATAAAPTPSVLTLSGPAWVAQFPGSRATADLCEAFRANLEPFIAALKAAGASVSIGATLRPPQRAHLMHYAWRIMKKLERPDSIPPYPGVGIQWDHGDDAKSIAAATQMIAAYALRTEAALKSLHTLGRAIDMTIVWTGALVVRNAKGQTVSIASLPRTGENAELAVVGRTYGVIKSTFAARDPPHWSDNGS